MDPFLKSCLQVAQAANKSGLSLEQFAKAMNSLPARRRRDATVVVNHNPSRLPYWPIVATPEIGCFGRLRWINSMPSEEAWGRVWWSNR
jgi:hypothetical protein